MGTELTTTDQAPGIQAISRLARQPQVWTRDEVLTLAGADPIPVIAAAKHDLMAAFEPVPAEGSSNREEWRAALTSRLNPLAAKIAPTMSKDQAAAWRNAMLDALADLPAMIGLTAAKRAIHVPMAFINEVDGVVRKIAAEIYEARRDAIARLERLIADLERAAQPVLPATPDEDVPPPTAEQVRAMKPEWIELGLTKGYLTQAMVDEARHGLIPDTDQQAAA